MKQPLNPLFGRQQKNIVLYRRALPGCSRWLEIRPLHPARDIRLLHQWVNQPYAKPYWQMEGPIGRLYRHYENFLDSGQGYSLMFFLDGRQVALTDYYRVAADELKAHYDYRENDYGIHLLMGPVETPVHGLTQAVMITALAYLFSLSIGRVAGEPDIRNEKANRLVRQTGFRFLKTIDMSYKTANLYLYDRCEFIARHGGVMM